MRKSIGLCLLSLCFLGMGSIAAKETGPTGPGPQANKCESNRHRECRDRDLCSYHRSQLCRNDCRESEESHKSESHVIGSAFGAKSTQEDVVIQAGTIGIDDAPVTAPLFHADVPEKAPFSFVPYDTTSKLGGFFTIKKSGKYLLQYGLTGVPSKQLASLFVNGNTALRPSTALWIGINVVHDTCQHLTGAIPLSFTSTANLDPGATGNPAIADGTKSYFICCGFGQIPVKLKCGDKVSLIVYLATNPNVGTPVIPDVKLYIGSENITWPFLPLPSLPGLSRGPTLTIERIGENSHHCHCD